MRLMTFFLFVAFLSAHAAGTAQKITLSGKDMPLKQIFDAVKKQTGYVVFRNKEVFADTRNVSLAVQDMPLSDFLNIVLKDQPVHYVIRDKTIFLSRRSLKEPASPDVFLDLPDDNMEVRGRVTDESGTPLLRISVTAVKSKRGTYTDEKGEFSLKDIPEDEVLEFTSVGYDKVEVAVRRRSFITVTMKQTVSMLDETVIMAYGKTTKRFNTGSIGKVTSEEIAQQPVSDPLAALHGKVPGLEVRQSSGVPGASIEIQIRGRGSIGQGSAPLIIVDGVPLAANNQNINLQYSILTTSFTMGLSPVTSISPLDIESIEVLKDADATAIYGSRGANGVVLITTKKGTAGKTKVFANFYSGWSKVSKLPEMLNTREYVEMRKEAFANDGLTPSTDPFDPGYAPDIMLWDTTRETNFSKMLLGNTAHTYNGQAGFSGGNENVQFFLSAGYDKEGTVFMGDMGMNRISVTNNINYTTNNKKFSARLTSGYSGTKSNLFNGSLAEFFLTPPNAPPLYTADGKLNWEDGGYYFSNPVSYLKKKYDAVTDNLLGNLQVEYGIAKGLSVRSSFGYNSMQVSETVIDPIAAQISIYDPVGSLSISSNNYKSWIVEPQAEYERAIGKGKLSVLIGSTFSQNRQNALSVEGTGYKSDNLLNSLRAATEINTSNVFSDYKYAAVFGRINYNWDQKYILNLTGRRDGSSRFGPGKQFANFGAVGAAWLFTEEQFVQKILPFISYGKLRASYGITGNDQIGNYQYLDTWFPNYQKYQGESVLFPTALFNPLYGWETNRKFETALELGFFKDRIYLSSVYFNNRCGNQLIQYTLASQTGFDAILSNFPALVQNSGFEFQLTAIPVTSKKFNWSVSANISLPSNKLVRFDGLSTSAYSFSYVEGKSLNIIYKLHFLGVNPATGVFEFEDIDKDNVISYGSDFVVSGKTDPRYYGGIRNTFTFGKIELDFFLDFRNSTGLNYMYSIYDKFQIPGLIANQPKYVLERWQKPGDVTEVQRFTTKTYSAAFRQRSNMKISNGFYGDASFVRLKTASIAWQLPATMFRIIKTYNSKIFISGQNLFTLTGYKGTDPETQSYYTLPPLRTIAVGINVNF